MTLRFTPFQEAAIRDMLLWRAAPHEAFQPELNRVTLAELDRALDLPAMRHSEFLGPECWLAGGQVLRWLCRAGARQDQGKGDFDFFFSSAEALDTTARSMLDRGFQLRGYRASPRDIRTYLRKQVTGTGDFGTRHSTGNMAPITPELIERLRLTSLELRSPEGDSIQLVANFQPTPLETIVRFDISICQLAVDHHHITFGPWAWNDLLKGRFRVERPRWPVATMRRMFKYSRRGFSPYAGAAVSVSRSAAARLVEKVRRQVPDGEVR